ncbi:MAG TPA: PAS domain S-box protein [Gallionella sp.]|nr:PAS domain S-box protein [Gallionella sp.]
MHIALILTIFLAGLITVYFWRANKILRRRMGRLSREIALSEADRRYKEIFDNGSDGVFVVEALPHGEFRFESLNPAAQQVISPQGGNLAGCRFDQAARCGTSIGYARFFDELGEKLRQCTGSHLPLEYESCFHASGEQTHLQVKLIPMADDAGLSHFLCFVQDITPRKLYEQELLERVKLEERLSGFAASAPGFFYTYRHGVDGSNAMPFASAGIGDIFGLQPEQVAKNISPMSLSIHKDDLKLFFDATARSAVDLSALSLEFRVQHPVKGVLWVESRSVPLAEADGSIEWHGFMHDVTERKLSEQRLRQAHEFTSGVINSISDPVFVKDRQHRWLMLNDACCELIGQAREDLIGKSDYEFFPKEQADEFWAGDERVFVSGLPDLNEEPITSSDGKTHFLHTKKTPYSQNGEQYLIAVIRDITERKKSEDALRKSRESLAEAQRIGQMGSWELDLASNELTWSDEIYRIFDIDPALFGASYEAFLNAIHPDDSEAVDQAYASSLANRKPYSIDHRLLLPDGRIKYVRECGETHYGENGEPVYSHGTVQDITLLKETEHRLNETQAKLRALVLNRESNAEGERKRIAWEMHEELGQLLASMRLRVHSMRSHMPKGIPALEESSRAVDSLIEKSLSTVLGIVADLRPTVLMHGPVAALEWLVAQCDAYHGIDCKLIADEDGTIASDELTLLVFRIAQESIENISRHTGVARMVISWRSNRNGACLTIRHDGEHFGSDDSQSLSFFGMQERASAFGGEMRIFDIPEEGAVIEVTFPSHKPGAEHYPLFDLRA